MYPPARECIYCGRKDAKLTREHIVPFGLGGQAVIPEASCKEHAEVTSRFERVVARGMYGIERADANIQSRRPHKVQELLRQKVEITGTDKDGRIVTAMVPQGEVPRMPSRIDMLPPGALRGANPDLDEGCSMSADPPTAEQIRKLSAKLGLSKITIHSGWLDPYAFVRQLAKIAHAFTWVEVGANNFNPVLLPLILGQPFSKSYLVGGFEPPARQLSTSLAIRRLPQGNDTLLVVDISLLCFPRLPRYQVVAGIAK